MVWTTPKTFVVEAVLTASEMNTYLRDNTAWLKDIIEGDATELISPKGWGDRLVGKQPVLLGTSDTTIYTCPADSLAVVTEIRVAAWAAVVTTVKAKGKVLANAEALGQYDTLVLPVWIVLAAGQTVVGSASVANQSTGSVAVAELPASMSGYTLRHEVGGAISASTWTSLLTATAGKQLRVTFVMLQAGGTPPSRLALGNVSAAQKDIWWSIPGVAANGCWRWRGGIDIPGGDSFGVWSDQALANWLVSGYEV